MHTLVSSSGICFSGAQGPGVLRWERWRQFWDLQCTVGTTSTPTVGGSTLEPVKDGQAMVAILGAIPRLSETVLLREATQLATIAGEVSVPGTGKRRGSLGTDTQDNCFSDFILSRLNCVPCNVCAEVLHGRVSECDWRCGPSRRETEVIW